MCAYWRFDKESIARWRKFVDANIKNDFVAERKVRNITHKSVRLSRSTVWRVLVGCQVTPATAPTRALHAFDVSTLPQSFWTIVNELISWHLSPVEPSQDGSS